jgi:hypothetical protein
MLKFILKSGNITVLDKYNDLLFFVLTSWAPYNSNAQMNIPTADETNLATRACSDSVNVSGNKLKQ